MTHANLDTLEDRLRAHLMATSPDFAQSFEAARVYGEKRQVILAEIAALDPQREALWVEGMLIILRNQMGAKNPVIELLGEAKLAEAAQIEAQIDACKKALSDLSAGR